MRSLEKSMQVLSRAVLKKAHTDADHVLEEAREKADAVRRGAQRQAGAERREVLEHARHKAEQIRSQAVAAAKLEARQLKLARREALLDEVFAEARRRLPTVRKWTDYDQVVYELVREAAVQLDADQCRIRADERAQQMLTLDRLAEISEKSGVALQLGQPLTEGVGVVAETLDGRRQYDNTLAARLDRQQEALRFPVHRLLMGESL